MSKSVRFEHPSDGQWVMDRVGGVYQVAYDHVIAMVRDDGVTLGGVVFCNYLVGSLTMHMAGTGNNWGTPDFLWLVYEYAFHQLGCRKVIGLVAADNALAIRINTKMGFREEARLADMTADGGDLLIMSMRRDDCRWLRLVPKHYRSNIPRRTMETV